MGLFIQLSKSVNQYWFGHSSKAYRPLLVEIPDDLPQFWGGKLFEVGGSLGPGKERFHQSI